MSTLQERIATALSEDIRQQTSRHVRLIALEFGIGCVLRGKRESAQCAV
jgi:hypothetical protein